MGEVNFEAELHDNFSSEIVEEVLSFEHDPDKAGKMRIVDFFKARGYKVGDIRSLLPIKFKRKRKKTEE